MKSEQTFLPPEFSQFEPFCSKWCLQTERERYLARAHAPYPDLVALYETMLPHLSEIITYLNQFPLTAMPGSAQNLMYLTFSLMEATHAVELWKQSDVPDAFEPERIDIRLAGGIA